MFSGFWKVRHSVLQLKRDKRQAMGLECKGPRKRPPWLVKVSMRWDYFCWSSWTSISLQKQLHPNYPTAKKTWFQRSQQQTHPGETESWGHVRCCPTPHPLEWQLPHSSELTFPGLSADFTCRKSDSRHERDNSPALPRHVAHANPREPEAKIRAGDEEFISMCVFVRGLWAVWATSCVWL